MTTAKRLRAGLAAFIAFFLAEAMGQDESVTLYDTIYADTNIRVPIVSYRERQFAHVIRQRYDFSCGSAALATLLSYHYDIPRNEVDVFVAMWEAGEQELIRERGFSLLDMKRYLDRGGVAADGFNVPFEKLNELALPGIALINGNGYSHFVVVKGVRGDQVLIGDPSVGLVVRSKDEFLASWDGTLLFLRGFVPWGRASWNSEEDWGAHPVARPADRLPLSDLAVETLHATRAFNSGFGVGRGF
ncbi:MAG: C39 family peptidase [Parvularcula sp.]|jgi:predicted double-glycine peptidase|nr:C39 family peptidase [Parvularcula sp.]